jgi:predicted AAA+ superfamily ATPase
MPHVPNISQLSSSIETSRATVMNYLKYLRNARLINLIYQGEADITKKPERVYLQNPNLLYAISMGTPTKEALNETFFLNQIQKKHQILGNGKNNEFLIDNQYTFKIGNNKRISASDNQAYVLVDMEEVGGGNRIPIWLFGFLY